MIVLAVTCESATEVERLPLSNKKLDTVVVAVATFE
jgi:hypothetical protein